MNKTIQEISIFELLPNSIQYDAAVKAAAQALDKELTAAAVDIRKCLLLPRLDELPESILDLLAWQWHVDFYEPIGMTAAKKRELIRRSIAWHRHKGTPWAVEQVVTAAVADATVHEWFEYGGEPGLFRIETGGLKSEDDYKNLVAAINSVKNTRSWLESIVLKAEASLAVYIGIAEALSGGVSILPRVPDRDGRAVMAVGVARQVSGNAAILAPPPADCAARLAIGAAAVVSGGRVTRANPDDMPVYEEFEARLVLRVGAAQTRGGAGTVYPSSPPDGAIRLLAGGAAALLAGRQSILAALPEAARQPLHAGLVVVKSGGITIKERIM